MYPKAASGKDDERVCEERCLNTQIRRVYSIWLPARALPALTTLENSFEKRKKDSKIV